MIYYLKEIYDFLYSIFDLIVKRCTDEIEKN